MSKSCNKCNISKNETEFSIRKESGKPHNTCKQCKVLIAINWNKINKELKTQYLHQYYLKNIEHIKSKARIWRKDNPKKAQKQDRLKHIRRRCHIPTMSNEIEIAKIYENCPKGFEVDHIIPLKNKLVSGLHVPWNLQYLPTKENNFKRNKFDGTFENNSWRKQCLAY